MQHYILPKVRPLTHHFKVYYNRHCVARFTWNGTTLTTTSNVFGVGYNVDAVKDSILDELLPVRDLMVADITNTKTSGWRGPPVIQAVVYIGS